MRHMKLIWLALSGLPFLLNPAEAQTSAQNNCKPPIHRIRWHEDIDKAQQAALKSALTRGDNEDVALFVSNTLQIQVDQLQCQIEKDSIGDQQKVGYLRGLERLIRNAVLEHRQHKFAASNFPALIDAYNESMAADKRKGSIEAVISQQNYEVGKALIASLAFDLNPGLRRAKNQLMLKYAAMHPDKIFLTLKEDPDVPFRDSLIKVAGYRSPRQLYDYAAADNQLGYAIRAIDDPLIKTVSKMAKSASGQLYFPFLDGILKGNQSLDEIDAVKDDASKYYKLLVKTKMNYVLRQLEGEPVTEMKALNAMLEKKANEAYVKVINDLHEEPDAIRFRVLNQLNAQELYYLVIFGERDLYTSSYVKGVYPLMMQRVGNKGDSLLMSVNFDHFKKFIRMAAGYNTLANFLNSFPDKSSANTLMTAFVNNIDRSEGLEDGVDVADSYASISENLKDVAQEMVDNVQRNYKDAVRKNNKRGMVIYDLLYKLFSSASDSTINLSSEFNIPPVYNVSLSSLENDSSGKVIIQVFFYGDEDGRWNYREFVPKFPPSLWKRTENKQWISFASLKGKPIVVYANKPLDEQSGEVDKAQAALCSYLSENELNPTIVVHRGHSYYAPYTIEQLAPSAKIVFLGSCGGYHLIHDVLEQAQDAHIIASKQIGKQVFNQLLIDIITEKVRTGSNIDWIPLWKEFEKKAGWKEGFGDYIPPHKNLGAIFIKAYKNAMGNEGI